jgi:hypothetical protein
MDENEEVRRELERRRGARTYVRAYYVMMHEQSQAAVARLDRLFGQ